MANNFSVHNLGPFQKWLRLIVHGRGTSLGIPMPPLVDVNFEYEKEREEKVVIQIDPNIDLKSIFDNLEKLKSAKKLTLEEIAFKKALVYDYYKKRGCPNSETYGKWIAEAGGMIVVCEPVDLLADPKIVRKIEAALRPVWQSWPDSLAFAYLLAKLYGVNLQALKEYYQKLPSREQAARLTKAEQRIARKWKKLLDDKNACKGCDRARVHLNWPQMAVLDGVVHKKSPGSRNRILETVKANYPEFFLLEKVAKGFMKFHTGGFIRVGRPADLPEIAQELKPPLYVRPKWLEEAMKKARKDEIETDPAKIAEEIYRGFHCPYPPTTVTFRRRWGASKPGTGPERNNSS